MWFRHGFRGRFWGLGMGLDIGCAVAEAHAALRCVSVRFRFGRSLSSGFSLTCRVCV